MSNHLNHDRLRLGGADPVLRLRRRRAEVEARIEELIALLDLLDGDENLEPYLAGTYPEDEDREDEDEREPEETDENGDEQDCSRSEDEWSPYPGSELQFDRAGVTLAMGMVRGVH